MTQADIDGGDRARPSSCPIALAMRRVFGDHAEVGINHFWPYYDEWPKEAVAGVLPKQARRFVREFDDGRSVEPFSFEVSFEDGGDGNAGES